jgi:hypothetical protein
MHTLSFSHSYLCRVSLGRKTLTGIATRGIEADDTTYAALDQQIIAITATRNRIADEMLRILEDAEFHGIPVDEFKAAELILEAKELLASAGI